MIILRHSPIYGQMAAFQPPTRPKNNSTSLLWLLPSSSAVAKVMHDYLVVGGHMTRQGIRILRPPGPLFFFLLPFFFLPEPPLGLGAISLTVRVAIAFWLLEVIVVANECLT